MTTDHGVPYLGSTQVTPLTDQYYHSTLYLKWFVAGIVMRYDADQTEYLLCTLYTSCIVWFIHS